MSSSEPSQQVPFFRYRHVFGERRDEFLEAMARVLETGSFILQEDVRAFERELAEFVGCRHAVGVGNATDALIIVLRALGIGPGDEVIVPAHTFVASAAAIYWTGATPVLCEIGDDHLIDPVHAESLVTPRTRVVMPVQLNGRTADMDAIGGLARRHGIHVVEDSSQALGSRFRGRSAGTWGKAGVFSFYPAKLVGAFGDAGAIVTDDDAVATQARRLRDHGRDGHGSEVQCWGMNSRLDTLHAAVLRVKLRHFREEIEHRRRIACIYDSMLRSVSGLSLPPGPDCHGDHHDVFQNYELQSDRRDELRTWLEENGVRTIVQWAGKGIHQFPGLGLQADLPKTDRFFRRCLLLPMNSSLSDDEARHIAALVCDFYSRCRAKAPSPQ